MKRKLGLLILILLLLCGGGCGGNIPQEPALINVIGMGKITAQPDELEVRFTVGSQGKDAGVQKVNAKKTQTVIDSLVELGLTKEEMETRSVNFYPLTKWDNKAGEQIIGYKAENTLLIRTAKTELVGEIIDTAVSGGASMVGNMAFVLSEEGKEELLDVAIEKAALDARKQAEAAAKAAGVDIGGIKEIVVQKEYGGSPINYNLQLMKSMDDAGTPVLPQDVDYMVSVRATYLIK